MTNLMIVSRSGRAPAPHSLRPRDNWQLIEGGRAASFEQVKKRDVSPEWRMIELLDQIVEEEKNEKL
jgi:hypothetical protein